MRIYRKNGFLFSLILGLAVWMQTPVIAAEETSSADDCKCTNCISPEIVDEIVGGSNLGTTPIFCLVQEFIRKEEIPPAQVVVFIDLLKSLQSEGINLDQFVDMQHRKEEIPQADIDAFKRLENFRQSEGIHMNQLVEMQPRFRVQQELRMRKLEVVPEQTRELKVVPEMTQELRIIEAPAQFK